MCPLETLLKAEISFDFYRALFYSFSIQCTFTQILIFWKNRVSLTVMGKARYFLGHTLVLVLSQKISTYWLLRGFGSCTQLSVPVPISRHILYASPLLQVTVPLMSPVFLLQSHFLIECFNPASIMLLSSFLFLKILPSTL